VEKYGTPRHATCRNTIRRMRIECWMRRLKTHTQNMQYLFLFHCNNGYANAPQCYVIRTLTVFFHRTKWSSETRFNKKTRRQRGSSCCVSLS